MMLRIIALRLTVIAGVLLAIFGFSGIALADSEQIDSFYDKIAIQADGEVQVEETIVYNFGAGLKHGIFRDIPLTVKDGPRLGISVDNVVDAGGKALTYTDSTSNDTLHIKIGDANKTVSGVQTYVIHYSVYNAIRQFTDHDELYWNVTGNAWKVGMRSVGAVASLPGSGITGLTMACFTGAEGSTEKNCTMQEVSNGGVQFAATRPLDIGEGMTLVLGVPKGILTIVAASSQPQGGATSTSSLVTIIIILATTAVFSVLMFFRFRRKNKLAIPVIPQELKGAPIVTEYAPPDGLPPIEVGTLLDRRVDITDISSVIMDLAVRGYIKIKYTVQVIKFWPDKKDFELVKLKSGADLEHPADKILFDLLFTAGRPSVTLSQLQTEKTAFQTTIELIKTATELHLHDEDYFDKAAKEKAQKYSGALGVLCLLLFGLFFLGNIIGPLVIVPGIIIGIPTIILGVMVSNLEHTLTAKGVKALAKILGFQQFLSLTETDRLRLLNAPELKPEIFEKYLPYAMVLGVEKQWAQKFEGIYMTPPDWYDSPTSTGFNSYMMVSNLALFDDSFNQVFNITQPHSSSSGFSGGFSGGGSGGGGGGSW